MLLVALAGEGVIAGANTLENMLPDPLPTKVWISRELSCNSGKLEI